MRGQDHIFLLGKLSAVRLLAKNIQSRAGDLAGQKAIEQGLFVNQELRAVLMMMTFCFAA